MHYSEHIRTEKLGPKEDLKNMHITGLYFPWIGPPYVDAWIRFCTSCVE